SDDARARSTLRRTLSALRSSLGSDVVAADRNVVALTTEVASDVGAFHAALAATGSHGHGDGDVCPACLPLLEEAALLYRGDFLAGFSLRDAPGFDDWSRTVAEGLRLDVSGVLERLAAGRAAAGDYRGAIEAAGRWIDLDPLHEPAHRTLMLLAAWAGDRPAAVAAYRRCVTVLNSELGVAPLEETTELYEAILDDDLPPPPGIRRRIEVRPRPVAAAATDTLIDRNAELQTLERELMWASTGGRVVLVTGDAWIGKTRLIEDFTRSAAERGHRVLLARGYRAERALAYGVVVQVLRRAHAAGWLGGGGIPGWALAETGRLLPEVEPASLADDGFGETRLFDGVATTLLAMAGGKTLVIAVDDGQWLDPASASFLSYLTHRLGDAGVLLLVAFRTDAASSPESAAAIESFQEGAVEVALEPFVTGDVVDLVPDEPTAARVIGETGGIPILVAEYLAGGETGSGPSPGVGRYIEERLRSLDGLTTQIVAAAAVLDGTCDVSLLRATSGRGEEEVVDAVEQLLRRRILREVPGSAGLGFTLEAMGQVAYDGLTPVRRRLLHRRSAAALAEHPGADRDARSAAAVANHLRLAGQDAEAARWYAMAGDLAAAVYAHAEAESAYRSALAMGHLAPGPIHHALGDVLLLGSRFQDALDAFQAAAAVGDRATAARAEHRIGEVHRRLGRFDQAEHHFMLAEDGHPDLSALYSDWALLEHRRGDLVRAQALARRAVELAPDDRGEGRARDILGIVTDDLAELELALELSADDAALRMAALNSLAHAVAREGDLERALDLVGEGIELAERVGDRHRRAALLNHRADLLHRVGRAEESQAALTAAVRLFADVQPDAWEPEVWLLSRW
ncbi:MAG: hypothetical protein EHM57_02075, partial [Actinobacteria bacterium]